MRLDQILEGIYGGTIDPSFREREIASVSSDSRNITDRDMFVALKGAVYNGEDFIDEAVKKGAKVIVAGKGYQAAGELAQKICLLDVDDPKAFLYRAARRLYGNPSERVRVIGVTGTNGKTTVTYLIESILKAAGQACGVIGTINARQGGMNFFSLQTTPDYATNQKFLHTLAANNIPYCVMEVSSHALMQGRADDIDFSAAAFTNLTGDHLDYHKSMDDYFRAKARLFEKLADGGTAVINLDDPYGLKLQSMVKAGICSYGIDRAADVRAEDVKLTTSESAFTLVAHGERLKIRSPLVGRYNIYNILAAAGACLSEGLDPAAVKKGIEALKLVPGRLERVEAGQGFTVLIDYAHTADALKNVLTALRDVSRSRIILVFGCGGDRDRTKRPLMAKVAEQLADHIIVTSDNPRSERPESVIGEIIEGFSGRRFGVCADRAQAIEQALAAARPSDIVLIAGKGHETCQILADRRIAFNERAIIENYLNAQCRSH